MIGALIAVYVFSIFFRKARKIGKKGFVWGLIGALSFYLPVVIIAAVALRSSVSLGQNDMLIGVSLLVGIAAATIVYVIYLKNVRSKTVT